MSASRAGPALAFLAALALYAATLAPTVTLEDSGEFIAAARHLGVPHPSGYPLWCLVAHAFTWLPLGSVAERVHAVSATSGAATVALVFALARRATGRMDAALLAAGALAVSRVLWSQSVIAEVYTLNAFFTVLGVWCAWRFAETGGTRYALVLAGAGGLGLANHPMLVLALPPLAVWMLAARGRRLLRPGVLAAALLLFAAGLSVYAYVPLRARADPPVNVGEADTLSRAVDHVTRRAYQAEGERARYLGGPGDVARHAGEAVLGTATALSWPLALLALAGAVRLARTRAGLFWTTAGIAVANTAVLNALLGAQFNPWWSWVHRVYYIPTHAVAALWIAAGAALCLEHAERRSPAARRWVAAGLALLVAGAAVANAPHASRRGDWRARDFALDLLDSAPERAGFVPLGDEILYPLVYMKHVEGVRTDVAVMRTDLGWDGEPVSALLSGLPLGAALLRDNPELRGFASVPHGLVYRFVRRPDAPGPAPPGASEDWAAFEPLPEPPRDAALGAARDDRFDEVLRRIYAAYHARLGARHLARREDGGAAELARAEALNPEDPYVDVLLYRIYRDFDLLPEHRRALLERALARYDRAVDPAIDRYYPLARADVLTLLHDAMP